MKSWKCKERYSRWHIKRKRRRTGQVHKLLAIFTGEGEVLEVLGDLLEKQLGKRGVDSAPRR